MSDQPGYECIDPALGGELWRLEDPATDAALRARLETHVRFCASCRQQLAVEEATETGLRSGELRLIRTAGKIVRRLRALAGAGGLAMAAGLALVLLLPPSPPTIGTVRGDEASATIERPVSGEVVPGSRPTLRWTAIDGATAYRVTVRGASGDYDWQVRVTEPSVRVPADSPLPSDERFRVSVEPVPAHLAPPGGLRTTFRTGNAGAFLLYRAGAGSLAGRILVAVGLVATVTSGLLLRRRRELAAVFRFSP